MPKPKSNSRYGENLHKMMDAYESLQKDEFAADVSRKLCKILGVEDGISTMPIRSTVNAAMKAIEKEIFVAARMMAEHVVVANLRGDGEIGRDAELTSQVWKRMVGNRERSGEKVSDFVMRVACMEKA